jgi:hypothetical protein
MSLLCIKDKVGETLLGRGELLRMCCLSSLLSPWVCEEVPLGIGQEENQECFEVTLSFPLVPLAALVG